MYLSEALGVNKLLEEISLIKSRFIKPPYIVDVVFSAVIQHYGVTAQQFSINEGTKAKQSKVLDSRMCFVSICIDHLQLSKNLIQDKIKGCDKSFYNILSESRQLDEKIKHHKKLIDDKNLIISRIEKIIDIKIQNK